MAIPLHPKPHIVVKSLLFGNISPRSIVIQIKIALIQRLFGGVNYLLLLWLFVSCSKVISFPCLDIDECGTNTDNCHVDANCTNTKGSFYCMCHTGYSGDGVICEGKIILKFMKKAN